MIFSSLNDFLGLLRYCGILVGNFLSSLIRSIKAKRVLEIGMFTGYSAASMVKAIPDDGELHTCEHMPEHIETANSFFKKYKYNNVIKIHSGLALHDANRQATITDTTV